MREVLSKSLTLRGYINYEFATEHYPAFLRIVGAAVADGRIRYREDITDDLSMRRPLSSACWKAAISERHLCALLGQHDIEAQAPALQRTARTPREI